jgi:hypothetical protein
VIRKLGKLGLGVGLINLMASTIIMAAGQVAELTAPPVPSGEEQDKLLAATRGYGESYLSNLPNFLCTQVTEQFSAGKNTAHWHRGDTLTSRLVFNQGREERSLEFVNDKPAKHSARQSRTPLTTEGEFGMLIESILGSSTAASFSWKGWDTVRGKRVAVFDYSIDKEHSRLSLSLSDLARAVVGYHGSIYVDASTGAVWRVTNAITEIPPEVRTKRISTTIEYEETAISGANYLLPVQASVTLFTGSSNLRNEIQFRNYRRFEADSTIIYAAGDLNNGTADTKSAGSHVPRDE